jgi:hypothetical protein
MNPSIQLRVRLHAVGGAQNLTLYGREAWALEQLIQAGKFGCTPIDRPGPRWSAYIHKLRRMGFDIETIHESHKGPFAGSHGRYVLRSSIDILPRDEQAA